MLILKDFLDYSNMCIPDCPRSRNISLGLIIFPSKIINNLNLEIRWNPQGSVMKFVHVASL